MDENGHDTILSATLGQVQILEDKLTPGNRYPFRLRLGPEFEPNEAFAYLRRAENGYEMYVESPLQYRGSDAQLRRFADWGRHGEPTLPGLFTFVRQQFGGARQENSPGDGQQE